MLRFLKFLPFEIKNDLLKAETTAGRWKELVVQMNNVN